MNAPVTCRSGGILDKFLIKKQTGFPARGYSLKRQKQKKAGSSLFAVLYGVVRILKTTQRRSISNNRLEEIGYAGLIMDTSQIYMREGAGHMIRARRMLSKRNVFNTDYKVWSIEFVVPIFGYRINSWLFRHGFSDTLYRDGCDRVTYIRRWFRNR